MRYSIHIESGLYLAVCVGEFDNFHDAKERMAAYIVDLIDRQCDRVFNAWENLKEDFSDEVQDILISYKWRGTADYEDEDIYEDDGVIFCSVADNELEISGKRDALGYNIRIETNTLNMHDPDENYHFTLAREYDGGDDQLTIKLLVNDGAVAVCDTVSDEARSCLEVLDLEEE